jgi:hypothetical protein
MQLTLLADPLHPSGVQSFFCTHPFQNLNQKQNYYTLATTLNWNTIPVLTSRGFKQEDLETLGNLYCTIEPTSEQQHFLQFFTAHWQPTWTNTLSTQNILNHTAIAYPEFISTIEAKTGLHPQKTNTFTSAFNCTDIPHPSLIIPQPNSTILYQFINTNWEPAIIPNTQQTKYLSSWGKPTGSTYQRSWKPANSWQITFSYSNSVLYRTASFSTNPTYISGEIQQKNFAEHIIDVK